MNVGISSQDEDATGPSPAAGEDGGAPEPNGTQPPDRPGVLGFVGPLRDLVPRIVRSGRSTPGQLSGFTVVIVLLAVVVAVVCSVLLAQRAETTDRLTTQREPLAAAAQEMYSALSDADVTVARSFLVADHQRDLVGERYEEDIADASTALARASSDASTVPGAAKQVKVLTRQLPVYTGLVEQARTNHRAAADSDSAADATAGEADLREASELMRSQLLPAAQRLYRINTAQLADEQQAAASFPWVALTLVAVLLLVLVVAQVYLRRRTKRVFNIGLVVGSSAVVVLLLWGATAVTVQSVFVNRGSETTAQEDVLVHSRITALRARSDEMFMLLADGDTGGYQEEFDDMSERLVGENGAGGLLARAGDASDDETTTQRIEYATNSAHSWLGIHDTIASLLTGNSRAQAIELATDTDDGGSSTATFTRLDRHLNKSIDSARERFRDDISNASNALTLLVPGIVVLSIVAGSAAAIGLRDRIREYR